MRPFLTPNESLSTFTTGARQFVVHLRAREFDLYGRARVKLRPILPSSLGLRISLRGRKLGTPVDRWFSFGSTFSDYGHYRIATKTFVTMANLLGARAPYPTYLPPNDFSPVARHIARRRAEGRASVVGGMCSSLVRVAGAALDTGLRYLRHAILLRGRGADTGQTQHLSRGWRGGNHRLHDERDRSGWNGLP